MTLGEIKAQIKITMRKIASLGSDIAKLKESIARFERWGAGKGREMWSGAARLGRDKTELKTMEEELKTLETAKASLWEAEEAAKLAEKAAEAARAAGAAEEAGLRTLWRRVLALGRKVIGKGAGDQAVKVAAGQALKVGVGRAAVMAAAATALNVALLAWTAYDLSVTLPRFLGEQMADPSVKGGHAKGNPIGKPVMQDVGVMDTTSPPPTGTTTPSGAGLPAVGTLTMELTRVHYEIEKVTGTGSSGQPRDAALEKKDDLRSITGHIPVDYSATWATGFGNLKGSIDFGFPATLEVSKQPNGRYTAKDRVLIKAMAGWSNKGLGFGRPTGIWIRAGQELAKDDKGSFTNGSITAYADWLWQLDFPFASGAGQGTGEWALASVTVSMRGLQNRNTTLTAIYKIAGR